MTDSHTLAKDIDGKKLNFHQMKKFGRNLSKNIKIFCMFKKQGKTVILTEIKTSTHIEFNYIDDYGWKQMILFRSYKIICIIKRG